MQINCRLMQFVTDIIKRGFQAAIKRMSQDSRAIGDTFELMTIYNIYIYIKNRKLTELELLIARLIASVLLCTCVYYFLILKILFVETSFTFRQLVFP